MRTRGKFLGLGMIHAQGGEVEENYDIDGMAFLTETGTQTVLFIS